MQSPYLVALSLMLLATVPLGRRTLLSLGSEPKSLKAVISEHNLTANKTYMTADKTGHGSGAAASQNH